MVYGATFRFDKAALIDELNDMADRVRLQWQEGKRLAARPRILITGCPIGGAAEKVVKAIEDNGGWVVGFENCTGAKATERCVEETGDVYDALTDKYLAIGCSCISPNDQRLSLLSQMVEEYQADGVVDVILQACHTYAMLALGLLEIFTHYGAIRAAHKLLTPLLRPLLGIPGYTGLALITDLQSTDAGAALTKELYDSDKINRKDLVIMGAWQYSGAGLINNYFSIGSALFASLTIPIIIPLLLMFVLKFVGAAITRLVLNTVYRRDFENE